MIFRYYVDQGRYLPFQTVETRGAWHLQAFTVGSKPFQHTFLAVANFCEDSNTGETPDHLRVDCYIMGMMCEQIQGVPRVLKHVSLADCPPTQPCCSVIHPFIWLT